MFTLADVPGSIEGATKAAVSDTTRGTSSAALHLLHVIDLATLEPGRNPVADLEVMVNELAQVRRAEDRPRLVAEQGGSCGWPGHG